MLFERKLKISSYYIICITEKKCFSALPIILFKEVIMACNYPKRYDVALTKTTKGVVLNAEQVVLCVHGIPKLPPTFYLYYAIPALTDATATMPVLISTPGGNIPLVDASLTAVTFGDLTNGTVLDIAKVNICNGGCCSCQRETITYFQLINRVIATAAVNP
jgi:hypothetical protein